HDGSVRQRPSLLHAKPRAVRDWVVGRTVWIRPEWRPVGRLEQAMNGRQRGLSLVLVLVLAAVSGFAASTAADLLLAKARSLEGRGLMDLAAQSWQQALMSDPNQPEALAGLARWAKQNGRAEEASQYLARLRKVNPQDPAIASVEAMKV